MKTGVILSVSFIAGVITIIIGTIFKIMHWTNSEIWLIAGVLIWLIFIVTALNEVQQSTNINRTEKLMWTVGFILMAGITAIIYLLIGRRKVVSKTFVE